MVVYYKEGSTSTKKNSTVICWDFETHKKVMGIPNEKFPLVIIARAGKLDVSRIFIDDGSSCDIIYSELFEKMNLT